MIIVSIKHKPIEERGEESRELVTEGMWTDDHVASGIVQVIGPFPVAADELNGETGVPIRVGPELPIGTIVLSAFYSVQSNWIATDSASELFVLVGTDNMTAVNLTDQTASHIGPGISHGVEWTQRDQNIDLTQDHFYRDAPAIVRDTGVTLWFGCYAPGLSGGLADVYALVQLP